MWGNLSFNCYLIILAMLYCTYSIIIHFSDCLEDWHIFSYSYFTSFNFQIQMFPKKVSLKLSLDSYNRLYICYFPLTAQALKSHVIQFTPHYILLVYCLFHLFFSLCLYLWLRGRRRIKRRGSCIAALAPSVLPLFVCLCHVDWVTGWQSFPFQFLFNFIMVIWNRWRRGYRVKSIFRKTREERWKMREKKKKENWR